MTTNTRLVSAAAASLLMLSSVSVAAADESVVQQREAAPAPAERKHSINLGVGTAWLDPSISYEYLASGGHALVLEANAFYDLAIGDDSMGAGAAIGYRWHTNGTQNSPFLGVHVGYDRGRSSITTETNGMSETSNLDHQTFYVVGNVGKRWLLRTNFNITARLGAGYAQRSLDTDSDDALTRELVWTAEEFFDGVPVTVDGELSVGYTF
jgi:hypothetical protein